MITSRTKGSIVLSEEKASFNLNCVKRLCEVSKTNFDFGHSNLFGIVETSESYLTRGDKNWEKLSS